jgi:hypothetical protein
MSACGRFGFSETRTDASTEPEDASDAAPDTPDVIGGRVLLVSMDDVATGNAMVATSDPTLTIACDAHCPGPIEGKRNNGYHIGDDHYFTIHRPELLTAAPYTVGFWLRTPPTTTGSQDCVSKPYGATTAGDISSVWIGMDGAVTYETTANGAPLQNDNITLSVIASDNQWHYLAATWDGAVKRVYADGSEAHSDETKVQTVIDSSEPIEIGRDLDFAGPVHYLLGDMDELVFYDRALTAAEIAMLPAIYSAQGN